jgi:hypothetical protein
MYRTTLDRNTFILSSTDNRFSIPAVMVPGRGTATGVTFASGPAGPDATLVFAAPGLRIVYVGHRIRK